MAKLYLIRRNLEAFTGPLTLQELKDAYKRMQFGVADEVSGHCGPWVSLDNVEKIKKQYPEIARIVHEEMVSAWGLASEHGTRLANEETRRLKVKSTHGIGLAMVFLLIAIAALLAAIYMANAAKMSSKAREIPDHPAKPEEVQSLLERGNIEGFHRYMQLHVPEIVDSLQQDRVSPEVWLPYLRSYAFTHDGQIPGLELKLLRGSATAPVDCSMRMWAHRWRASYRNWNQLISGEHLPHAHWARILAWDPNWIRRRDNKGWLSHESYYGGCLNMAYKALNELQSDPSLGVSKIEWERYGLSKIKVRLEWQLALLQNATALPGTPAEPGNWLSIWSCYESAANLSSLQRCKALISQTGLVSQDYGDERYGWNLLRLAATVKGPLPAEFANQLAEHADKLAQEDSFTRLDYRSEWRLLNKLTNHETPLDKGMDKAQAELPNAKLSH